MKGFGPLWAVTTAFMVNGLVSAECGAAGVTVITHGFVSDGSLPGWVPAMADQIPNCYWFRGTNFTTYRIAVTYNSSDGNYYISSNRTNGISPAATDSGEIFVELDWSSLSGDVFDSVASTYSVAWPVAWALMQ